MVLVESVCLLGPIGVVIALLVMVAPGEEVLQLEVVIGVDREHVRRMQEAVPALPEVDEGCPDRGLEVDDPAPVDVVDESLLTLGRHQDVLDPPVLVDRNPAFLRLHRVDCDRLGPHRLGLSRLLLGGLGRGGLGRGGLCRSGRAGLLGAAPRLLCSAPLGLRLALRLSLGLALVVPIGTGAARGLLPRSATATLLPAALPVRAGLIGVSGIAVTSRAAVR